MANLLDIIRKVTPRLGLKRPSAIVGATDLTSQMLLEFANQEGDELSRYHDWQNLIVEQTYTTVAQVEQTGALDSDDYDRLPFNVEIWNRSSDQRYTGPTPQRIRQLLKSSGVTAGVAGWWWIQGNELQIYPAPTAGQTIAFEYITKNWCESVGGTAQSEWLADTDVPRIPARLLELGLIWRFQQSRGLATYAESMSTYEREKEKAASRDRGSGRMSSAGAHDGNWPPSPFWNGTTDN